MIFTDVDAATHVVENRIIHPLVVQRLWFQAAGYTLGYTKPMRIGNPTEWFFFNPEGRLTNRLILPDAASDVAQSSGAWYVACRDGALYAFHLDGSQLWKKRFAREREASPCPIVAAGASRVVLGHEDRFWLLDQYGNTQWESRLPHCREGLHTVAIPNEVPTLHSLRQRLGSHEAGGDNAASIGYFRWTLSDPHRSATKQMLRREIEILGGRGDLEDHAQNHIVATVRLELGAGTLTDGITRISVSEGVVAVGTTDGVLYVFDHKGTLRKTFALGNGPVSMILVDNQGLRAAHCGGILTTFRHCEISGYLKLPEYYVELLPRGADTLAWKRESAWIIRGEGHVTWAIEFGKCIRSVISDDCGFWVLAEQLFRFRAAPNLLSR